MGASLCIVNVPVTDMARARKFYGVLFDLEPARSLAPRIKSEHLPISRDGIQLTLTQKQRDGEYIGNYFGVKDIKATIESLKKAGGKLIHGPFDMPVSSAGRALVAKAAGAEPLATTLGKAAIVADPEGNLFGLLQLDRSVHKSFKVGEFHQPLTAEQLKRHQRSVAIGKSFAAKQGAGDE
jgi:predicted enzyme related to lactoylglutathione lyase